MFSKEKSLKKTSEENRKGCSGSGEDGHGSSEVSISCAPSFVPGKELDISDNRHSKDVVEAILWGKGPGRQAEMPASQAGYDTLAALECISYCNPNEGSYWFVFL